MKIEIHSMKIIVYRFQEIFKTQVVLLWTPADEHRSLTKSNAETLWLLLKQQLHWHAEAYPQGDSLCQISHCYPRVHIWMPSRGQGIVPIHWMPWSCIKVKGNKNDINIFSGETNSYRWDFHYHRCSLDSIKINKQKETLVDELQTISAQELGEITNNFSTREIWNKCYHYWIYWQNKVCTTRWGNEGLIKMQFNPDAKA